MAASDVGTGVDSDQQGASSRLQNLVHGLLANVPIDLRPFWVLCE